MHSSNNRLPIAQSYYFVYSKTIPLGELVEFARSLETSPKFISYCFVNGIASFYRSLEASAISIQLYTTKVSFFSTYIHITLKAALFNINISFKSCAICGEESFHFPWYIYRKREI